MGIVRTSLHRGPGKGRGDRWPLLEDGVPLSRETQLPVSLVWRARDLGDSSGDGTGGALGDGDSKEGRLFLVAWPSRRSCF